MIFLYVMVFLPLIVSGQNLVNMNDWVSGTSGATTNYGDEGTATHNSRITMMGPYGANVTVWEGFADGSSGMNGGLRHKGITVDTNKSYRVSFWLQSEGANNCNNYAGFIPYDTSGNLISSTQDENGNNRSWPYFSTTPLPNGQWYLVVGYIRSSSISDVGNSGVYDPSQVASSTLPQPSYTATDFMFPSNTAQIKVRIRSFLWNCGAGEKVFIYDPRIEEINGNEVPLLEVLTGNNGNIAVTGISLSPSNPTIGIGATQQLTATVSPNDATNTSLIWNSSDTAVATVNDSGTVTGIAEGNATITATSISNGAISAQTAITVSSTTQPPSPGSHWTKENDNRLHFTAGNVGIGTSTPGDYRLAVNGDVRAKRVKVEATNWPDYVFTEDYDLPTLESVKKHIAKKGHLPNIPSAQDVQAHGLDLGDMNRLLLEKIEELTLYIIDLKEESTQLQQQLNTLRAQWNNRAH
ncbi:MAG: Ig-like domain-containing protein [Flavobacteriaceae bacterium]